VSLAVRSLGGLRSSESSSSSSMGLSGDGLFDGCVHVFQHVIVRQLALDECDELRSGHRVQLKAAGGPQIVEIADIGFACAVDVEIPLPRGPVYLRMVLVLTSATPLAIRRRRGFAGAVVFKATAMSGSSQRYAMSSCHSSADPCHHEGTS